MDIQERRYVTLFNTVHFFAFGTLWNVKNYLWRKVFSGFVSKNDEETHPAVSLGQKELTSLCQTVPMLLGSHSNSEKGFPIRNFSPKKEKKAGFFKIRPFFFQAADAAGLRRGIVRNDYKPSLDQTEIAQLKTYLAKKGIRFDD